MKVMKNWHVKGFKTNVPPLVNFQIFHLNRGEKLSKIKGSKFHIKLSQVFTKILPSSFLISMATCMFSITSMAQLTWSVQSSSGKSFTHNHWANSSSNSTFSHSVLGLWYTLYYTHKQNRVLSSKAIKSCMFRQSMENMYKEHQATPTW